MRIENKPAKFPPRFGERRMVFCKSCNKQARHDLEKETVEYFVRRRRRTLKRIGWRCRDCGFLTVFMERPG